MPKIELVFQVDKVLSAQNPTDQYVQAVQATEVNQPYRYAVINLPVIDDDALKQFGAGQQWNVTIEF